MNKEKDESKWIGKWCFFSNTPIEYPTCRRWLSILVEKEHNKYYALSGTDKHWLHCRPATKEELLSKCCENPIVINPISAVVDTPSVVKSKIEIPALKGTFKCPKCGNTDNNKFDWYDKTRLHPMCNICFTILEPYDYRV